MSPPPQVWLVTGATGALGRWLVAELAALPHVERVYALIHRAPLNEHPARVVAVSGDLTAGSHLGLERREAQTVAGAITGIIHAGADTRFAAPLSVARHTNVTGTRNALAFAAQCQRCERFLALSTTHVAGRRTGVILEGELEHDRGFVNAYEASKYEAERELRRRMADFPIAVCRLSTVVGDSHTGDISRKSAIHQAVLLMYASLAPMVPGREDSPIDLLALDHVVRAIAFLATRGFEAGRTWHLCAGSEAVPAGALLDLTMDSLRQARPAWRQRAIARPAFVDLETFELFRHSVNQIGDSTLRASIDVVSRFAPQLAFPKRFDDRWCRAALAASGIEPPSIRDVWCRVVQRLVRPAAPTNAEIAG